MSVDEIYKAQHLFEQRRFQDCIDLCGRLLQINRLDQAAWFLKLRAITERDLIDDSDLEPEGIAEMLLDENTLATDSARPGTSLQRPLTTAQGVRPMTGMQRLNTGFARPSTTARLGTASDSIRQTLQSGRPGTSRPITVAGRQIRLGTQSILLTADNENFINSMQIDIDKFTKCPALAMALCDFLLYIDHNPKKALELAIVCVKTANESKWWWQSRLAKAYYQLGMYREAQSQLKLSLQSQEMVSTVIDLGKVFLRMDQPNSALDCYSRGLNSQPGETQLYLAIARTHQSLNDFEKAGDFFRKVLQRDSSNVEAIASIASQYFYNDQPEIALRFYRRLLQMGVSNTELWTNIGLCCFYCSQYDVTLSCFDRALQLADDYNMADVWYNISHIAIGIGDLSLAMQALKICISIDAKHAEAFNNLGVLELRKGSRQQACSYFETAADLADFHFEPFFNSALVSEAVGDRQKSWNMVSKALKAFPGHPDSIELRDQLIKEFISN